MASSWSTEVWWSLTNVFLHFGGNFEMFWAFQRHRGGIFTNNLFPQTQGKSAIQAGHLLKSDRWSPKNSCAINRKAKATLSVSNENVNSKRSQPGRKIERQEVDFVQETWPNHPRVVQKSEASFSVRLCQFINLPINKLDFGKQVWIIIYKCISMQFLVHICKFCKINGGLEWSCRIDSLYNCFSLVGKKLVNSHIISNCMFV